MRGLRRNKVALWCCRYEGEQPEYKKDSQGNIIYDEIDGKQVPRKTGRNIDVYSDIQKIWGNLAASGGLAEVESYGVDLSAYDAILYYEGELDETTYIWREQPESTDVKTADYLVARVPPVLNERVYFLRGVG